MGGLCAEMEATTFNAVNTSQYMGRIGSTPDWRTNMYAYSCAETMSLRDQIELVDSMDPNFNAEAKTPEIPMPFEGDYTQTDFIQQIVDTFEGEGIDADRVWLQSFLDDDIYYWLDNAPDFVNRPSISRSVPTPTLAPTTPSLLPYQASRIVVSRS